MSAAGAPDPALVERMRHEHEQIIARGREDDRAAGVDRVTPLIAEARRMGPQSHRRPDPDTPVRPAARCDLRLLSLDEYDVRPRVAWLVRDLIAAGVIMVVFGAPKSGKTHAVLDLTMHAAHGMHWHGHTVTSALRVVYLAGEGHAGLRVRLHAWRQHHATELRGDYRVLAEALPLIERYADLLGLLGEYAPDLIVVDTLSAYYGRGDENATQDMTAWVAVIRGLRDSLGCSIVIVHHTGLGDQSRERGSNVLRGAADVIVQVARDESGSGLIGLQVVAARDMEPWDAPLSLRLTPVTTDWADDEGQPITTCLLEAGDGPVTLPGRQDRPLGDAQSALLAAAQELAARHQPDQSGEVILLRHDVSALAQGRGLDRRRVSQSWRTLASRRLIRLIEPGSVAVTVTRR